MTKIFAHRGYSALYPENTLLAFSKAIEAGCDGIELDVHLTKDGEIAVIHDEDVRRTTDGAGLVADMTLSELKSLSAGRGERVPLLAEYFDIAGRADIITNIELKTDVIQYEGLEEKVVELVLQRGLSGKVIFSSFHLPSVDRVMRLAPGMLCGYLFSPALGLDWEAIAARMRDNGVKFVHPNVRLVSKGFLAVARKYSIPFGVWTVNNVKSIRKMVEYGAYSVFTDDPTLLRQLPPAFSELS